MNERIKELVKQADEYADDLGLGGGEWCDAQLQKLVELIALECIDSIKVWRDATDETMEKEMYMQGYRSGCDDGIVEIQQRFGI